MVLATLLVGAMSFPTGAQTGETTPTTLSAEDLANKAEAASNLNAAKAADSEIAAALADINEAAQATQSKIDRAQASLEVARATIATTTEELEASSSEQAVIEEQLLSKAVEGFKSGREDPVPFFTDHSINQSIRQSQLLEHANKSTAELLEDLRALLEDRQVAQAEAMQAAQDAEDLEAELTAELDQLREQSTVQLQLKAEAESRIAKWEAELSAYAAEDDGIRQLIADSSAAALSAPIPAEPSSLGFQWPIVGTVTSEYGYRIHPVYGTRKLHSGMDISAPRGTPIAATSGGVVISSGWRGGYGNTVIVDHGGGVSSLYAHMSQLGVSVGQAVNRGDAVGLVGATGTATGNHLHFEIRENGSATNPRPYLP
jgi:murein DD-endopeptidase MepM/ murein hydrolase activator NlpD